MYTLNTIRTRAYPIIECILSLILVESKIFSLSKITVIKFSFACMRHSDLHDRKNNNKKVKMSHPFI